MDSSYGALASSTSVSVKLVTRMELPLRREPVLDFFERLRKERPRLERLRRFPGELALETAPRAERPMWVCVRKRSVRAGAADPAALADAHRLNKAALENAPMYLTIAALDVAAVEVTYGFDLDAAANHSAIVQDALLSHECPLSRLTEGLGGPALRFEPRVEVALDDHADTRAIFEVTTGTTPREARAGRYDDKPIGVLLTLRRTAAFRDVRELPGAYDELAARGERLVDERLIPMLLNPIRAAIASRSA